MRESEGRVYLVKWWRGEMFSWVVGLDFVYFDDVSSVEDKYGRLGSEFV